jgi:hypothetical protein
MQTVQEVANQTLSSVSGWISTIGLLALSPPPLLHYTLSPPLFSPKGF